ncbi:MAG TPA: hypothetical protein VIW45_01680, partial [Vicinamibacterales bacterium]
MLHQRINATEVSEVTGSDRPRGYRHLIETVSDRDHLLAARTQQRLGHAVGGGGDRARIHENAAGNAIDHEAAHRIPSRQQIVRPLIAKIGDPGNLLRNACGHVVDRFRRRRGPYDVESRPAMQLRCERSGRANPTARVVGKPSPLGEDLPQSRDLFRRHDLGWLQIERSLSSLRAQAGRVGPVDGGPRRFGFGDQIGRRLSAAIAGA